MKVVFLGAGRGSRLQGLIGDRPKWLLEVGGQSLLQHSVNVMHQCNVTSTLIVRGALGGKIYSPSAAYQDAPNTANMVETLFSARDHLHGDVIVSYSDIIYEPRVVSALLNSQAEISVVIDCSWRNLFSLRSDDAASIAESCELRGENLVSVGQPLARNENPKGQYIGLMRFSASGLRALTDVYDELLQTKAGQPWRNASCFQNAYFTDLLQEMIDRGHDIKTVRVNGGWMEFDTQRDFHVACDLLETSRSPEIFDFTALPKNPSVLSSGGVALRTAGDRREALLVGSGRDGEWRIPKGMLAPGETVEAAATREVMEETGLEVKIESFVTTSRWTYAFDGIEWSEQCFFHKMRPLTNVRPRPDAEHAVAAWLCVDHAISGMMYANERDVLLRALK